MSSKDFRLRLDKRKVEILTKKANLDYVSREHERILSDLQSMKEERAVLEEARLLLSESSYDAKERVRENQESLITTGLQYVFGDDRYFRIDLTRNRDGKAEAEYLIGSRHEEDWLETPLEESRGGGVADIVGLVMQSSTLESMDPPSTAPIIFDEPVKMMSTGYIQKVGEFVQQLNETFHRQIIIVSHSSYLQEIGDRIFQVTQENGVSQVAVIGERT